MCGIVLACFVAAVILLMSIIFVVIVAASIYEDGSWRWGVKDDTDDKKEV